MHQSQVKTSRPVIAVWGGVLKFVSVKPVDISKETSDYSMFVLTRCLNISRHRICSTSLLFAGTWLGVTAVCCSWKQDRWERSPTGNQNNELKEAKTLCLVEWNYRLSYNFGLDRLIWESLLTSGVHRLFEGQGRKEGHFSACFVSHEGTLARVLAPKRAF